MARWKKWILFYVASIIIFVIFTSLEGLKLIQGGRWIWITGTIFILYYFILIKKPKIKLNAIDEVKYDFGNVKNKNKK